MGEEEACLLRGIARSTALCREQTAGTFPSFSLVLVLLILLFLPPSLCVLLHRNVCRGVHIKHCSVFTQCSTPDCSASGTAVQETRCLHLRPKFHSHCAHVPICYGSTGIDAEFSMSCFSSVSSPSPQCVGDDTSAVLLGRDLTDGRDSGGTTGAGRQL